MTEGHLHPWGCTQRMDLGGHFWGQEVKFRQPYPLKGS